VNRRPHLILVALLAAALLGVALLAIPGSPMHKSPTLGLDLQGGLEVTLKGVPEKGGKLTESDLNRSVDIMRNRVDKLGVGEQEIRKQDPDQIVVALPGVRDPDAAAKIIGKTAQLELYDLEKNLVSPSRDATGFPVAKESLFSLLAGQQAKVKPAQSEAWYLFDKNKKLVAGPTTTRKALLDSKAVRQAGGKKGELPKGWRAFGVPPQTVVISCAAGEICPSGAFGTQSAKPLWYLVAYKPNDKANPVPEMTGGDLKLSGTRQDFDTSPGGGNRPIVTMQFTGAGKKKFEEVTRAEAQRGKFLTNTVGQGQKILQHFAIVLDREIRSWPSIDWEENPNGIGGNNGAQITGDFTIGEAKDLALVLQTGALPVKFVTLQRTDVSATLGKDSLQQAKTAAIVGLLVVALFLLVVYRFLGVVAVVGLGIYSALLYAAILLFNVTLTLPGFAGMVLTLGVAADANIVIFERIKEEFRAGKSVRAAIRAGYSKGFHTIVDANVVTALTALVLFAVATAGVKGFALMLLIGTAISLLTAVAATRAILGLLAGFSWFDNPRFMGAAGQQWKWIQKDIIGRRNVWFAISGIVVAVSLGAILFRGLNLGIDFEGGTAVSFKTPQATAIDDVRSQAARIGQGNAQIQGVGSSSGGDSYREFKITTDSLTGDQQQRLTNDLQNTFQADSIGVKNVSASFGRQIARSAILAIFASLLLVVIYIAFRFQPKFAIPVIVAMLHDVLIAVGIYALTGREVTTATVAAILTVLGYSIYDTIIILDRIRENIPLMRRASFKTITNVSLWETIPRSLATTFITLLPITSLLLFGGETLKDFAFALFVGIGSGAYSSIFVAAPLLDVLKEREPEYARRRDTGEIVSVGGVLQEAEEAAAAEPEPALTSAAPATPATVTSGGDGGSSAKRERRRQRRSSRPHGRAR
jgi:SecD/SecF fusion protein